MADIETKVENETATKVVSSPEKKVVDDEKKINSIEVHEPEVDEDSKSSENGDAKVKENGSTDEKETDVKEESPKKDSAPEADACCIKRKSVSADATNGTSAVDGASPEKKAKLDDKPAETETNGDAAETKA